MMPFNKHGKPWFLTMAFHGKPWSLTMENHGKKRKKNMVFHEKTWFSMEKHGHDLDTFHGFFP